MKIPKQAYTTEFKELAVKRVKDGQSISTVKTGLELRIYPKRDDSPFCAIRAGASIVQTLTF